MDPFSLPRLRVALALGDQEREQRIRPVLDADDELSVTAQCLAADQLVEVVVRGQVDAVVVAWGLHRLTHAALAQVEHSGIPLVLLGNDDLPREPAPRTVVLRLDADGAAVRNAIKAARRGVRPHQPTDQPARGFAQHEAPPATVAPTAVAIAIGGSHGSPGRTTLAVNLATALGAVAPTVLVDLDLTAPSVSAFLDLDPTRNVSALAHAARDGTHGFDRLVANEVQPICERSAFGVAIAGIPKREMRSAVTAEAATTVIRALRQAYRYVIIDIGAEIQGGDPAALVHRAAVGEADHTLFVAGADLVSLWHARVSLDQLERSSGIEPQRLSLVINRHAARRHHSRTEIEWHLGQPSAAVIAYDDDACQRAIVVQQPLVLDGRSRAARAILDLARRVHGSEIRLPAAGLHSPPRRKPQQVLERFRARIGVGFAPSTREPVRAVEGPAAR